MKYHYFYQTSKNESADGWIAAKDRNDAYAQLRKRGIKPYKLLGKNPLPWRRWALVAVPMAALAGMSAWLAWGTKDNVAGARAEFEVARHQIYGDRSIIENGIATRWSACGLSAGEQHLARYAQPGVAVPRVAAFGKIVAAVDESLERRLEAADGELTEYRQIKGIVEAMKSELRRYKASGGTTESYLKRLHERQKLEIAFYLAAEQELKSASEEKSDDELNGLWAEKNAELRAIGLPMLPNPRD